MPVFEPRNRVQILRQMIARAVARSRLAGLFRNSVVYHILKAAADEDAEQYFQIAQVRDVFDLDKAKGSDLDARAEEIVPNIVFRQKAQFATSTVRFSRPTSSGERTILERTRVGARDARGIIAYRTTSSGAILDGQTISAPIPIIAEEAGDRANVSAGEISLLLSAIPGGGVTGVINEADVTNGRPRESDDRFSARKKSFVQAISRGTPLALETFARNVRTADGQRVLFAKLHEPNPPNGTVTLYIDDGTGQLDSTANRETAGNDIIVNAAQGKERDVFTSAKPIDDDGSFQLRLIRSATTTALVRNVDYFLAAPRGQITFRVSGNFSSGQLEEDDHIEATYTYFTGLVQQTQRVIDGSRTNRAAFPGVRAGGITTFVFPARTEEQWLEANIAILDDFSPAEVIDAAKHAVIKYINNLDISEDVIIAEIIRRAKSVRGVYNFRILTYKGSTSVFDQIIPSDAVARVIDSSKVVFV